MKTSKRPRARRLFRHFFPSTRARQAPSGAKHVPATMSVSIRQAGRLRLKTIAKRRAEWLARLQADVPAYFSQKRQDAAPRIAGHAPLAGHRVILVRRMT